MDKLQDQRGNSAFLRCGAGEKDFVGFVQFLFDDGGQKLLQLLLRKTVKMIEKQSIPPVIQRRISD